MCSTCDMLWLSPIMHIMYRPIEKVPLSFQWRRRHGTVRCLCRAVRNTSSTSAELGNTRKHSAAGAATSLDRGLSTHSTDNGLSSLSSTSPEQPVTSSSIVKNLLRHVDKVLYYRVSVYRKILFCNNVILRTLICLTGVSYDYFIFVVNTYWKDHTQPEEI